MQPLYIGISAFTVAACEAAFYWPGMRPADCLSFYAAPFSSVKVDSTFYLKPS
jgi:uncharacterized protein YecE (DUF72 family)